jgi:ABC-type glycerol-3-phosphate transport system substrate-binding protein
MQKTISFLAILLLCAAIGIAGCTGPTSTPAQQPAATGAPAATQAPSAPAQNNLVTSPTDVVPDNNYVSVIVQEKEYTAKIPVVFDGGKGQYLVKSAEVWLYRSDGQFMKENLGIKKGDTVYMEGTKQTDRVVVYVSEMNGQTYKVADVLSEYRTR